jgi:iron complex outermembrane receptor protein
MIRNVLKPLGSARVAFALAVGLPVFILSNAFAQEPAPSPAAATGTNIPPAGAGSSAEVERVIVTGSNIPTAEEVGPNPVDTYRRDDITRLGVRSSTDLVQKIPAATGSSVNENNTNGGDGTTRINLRGIDPKETLILQDGRRLANVASSSDSVDFNLFPLGLIDHIDILKDGASPNYGSDAVAGVVNVYLIHRFRGLELYASYGNSNLGFANDAGEETAYLLAGTGDDKTNIVVYAGFYNRSAIYSRDVNISHDADHSVFGGADARSGNYAGRVGASAFVPRLNGGIRTPTAHAFPNRATDPQYIPRTDPNNPGHPNPLIGLEHVVFNFADLTPEISGVDREYFYGSFNRDICDKYLTVFADFRYTRTFFDGALAPTPFTPDVFTDSAHPFGISGQSGISVPIQNAFNPFTVADYTSPGGFNPLFPNTQVSAAPAGTGFTTAVRYRSLEAGLRTDKIKADNYLFTGGLNGNLGEFGDYLKTWNWELGFRYNDDYRTERTGGIVNNNALRIGLLDTNPLTAFNPFGINQNSPSVVRKIFITANHLSDFVEMLEDFKVNGDLFNIPGGPVSFAVGTEHRKETIQDNPDALTASGQTTGSTNFGPTRGTRDVWSVWWEVRVPITSPTWNIPGFYSLEVTYAERFEDFSDFGNTEKPKFQVRWQPIDSAWTLRATYVESFHAPTLGELFSGFAQTFPTVRDPQNGPGGTTGTEPQVEQDLSGNPNLQPETAYEYTIGTVITPGKWWSALQGITVSVDWTHLDVRGFTSTLDPQFVLNNELNGFGQFVLRAPPLSGGGTNPNFGPVLNILTPTLNLGRFIEKAIDYEFVYTLETSRFGHGDMGTFTTTFNGTYIDSVKVQFLPSGGQEQVVGKFGGGFQGTTGGGNFTHNRWYASLFYDGPEGSWLGGLDTGATVHYVGQYNDVYGDTDFNPLTGAFRGTGAFDRKIREWVTLDLLAQYTFNMPAPTAAADVAGYSKDGGKNVKMKDGKDKNVMPVSTAEYNPCGWRAWLDKTTLIVGVENVTDEQPPFVAAAFENGFDEQTANAKGRFWYVAVKKRF